MRGAVAHLGHVELLTDRFDDSLAFFTGVYGLKLTERDGDSAWLRAWDDYEHHSLKLTKAARPGLGHVGYRAASAEDLAAQVAVIEASGTRTLGWHEGDPGHGPAFRFLSPSDHVFELYWETRRHAPPEGDRPALKNMASRYTGQGAAPRRIDHLNLLAPDVAAFRAFMETCLGSRVTEMIALDNGRLGGAWFTVNNKTYDLACTEDHGRGQSARFHHLTYATDTREDILRAADLFLEHGVHIETGPHKHAIQGTFFLYVWEPAGIRVELANSGARLILAPDHAPVIWTETERKRGQAWGLKTIETFHTHGTPPLTQE